MNEQEIIKLLKSGDFTVRHYEHSGACCLHKGKKIVKDDFVCFDEDAIIKRFVEILGGIYHSI